MLPHHLGVRLCGDDSQKCARSRPFPAPALPNSKERERLAISSCDRVGLLAALDHLPFIECRRRHRHRRRAKAPRYMPEAVTVSARALIGRRAALASLVKCGNNPQCSAARRDGARRSRGDAAPRVRVGSARDSRTDRCSAADSPCRIIWRAPLRAENWRSDHTWTERTPSLRKGKARRATWRPGSRRAQVSCVGLSAASTAACAFAPGDFIRWSRS